MKEIIKTYGPYLIKTKSSRAFGRNIIVLHYSDGTKKSTQYARYLMEQKLGRELTEDETVDHINRDKLDDRLENLRIISRSQHISDDSKRVKFVEITCVLCGKKSMKNPRHIRHNAKQGKAGPFCDRKCAGTYGEMIQNNKIKELPTQPSAESEYFYKDK